MKYDEVSRVELPKWLLATVFLLFALLFVHASTASGCIKPKRVRNLPPMNGVAGASPKTDVVCFCRPAGIGRLLL